MTKIADEETEIFIAKLIGYQILVGFLLFVFFQIYLELKRGW